MKNALILLRPQQWLKNTFVFLPLFFSGQIAQWELVVKCVVAFFAYSFAASSIYCFNDICDVKSDRQHPQKRLRPIASGAVSEFGGYVLMLLSLGAGLALAWFASGAERYAVMGLIAFYYVMNLAYCLYLKQKALVDVFIIATGFVLRVVLGGLATGIVLSHWIVLMTFLLALFLAFAKRRDDVVLYAGTGVKARKNINRYNLEFMNQAITIVATITIVAYVMYTVSEEVMARVGSPYLYSTTVFVLLGILRYLQLTIVDVKSGSPTKVLMKDRFLQACMAGWILAFVFILYVPR